MHHHHSVDDMLIAAHEYYVFQMITQVGSQSTIYKVWHTTCPTKSTNHVSILTKIFREYLKFQIK